MTYKAMLWLRDLPLWGAIEVYSGGDYHRFYAEWIKDLEAADLALKALGFTRVTPWDDMHQCQVEPIPVEEWKVWRASQPESLRV